MSAGTFAARDAMKKALLAVLMDEYGGSEDDWTAMRSLDRVARVALAAALSDGGAA